MNIKKKLVTAAALGSLAASVLAPASSFAATNVTISGNGFGTYNGASIWSKKINSLRQTNRTNVNTTVNSFSNTGGNKSSFNTGGSNSITTGSTTTSVGIGVTGNSNTNTAEPCGCDEDTDVKISGNQAFSKNNVSIGMFNFNSVNQSNKTTVNTTVNTVSNTGHNSSSFNTGDSSNTTDTGDTDTAVGVVVEGGTNSN